jgi:hypothetical protein
MGQSRYLILTSLLPVLLSAPTVRRAGFPANRHQPLECLTALKSRD